MTEPKKYILEKENELRVEIADKEATVVVLSGTAEIFGSELALYREYTWKNCNLGIFTWHGAVIQISGNEHCYVSSETPMVSYMKVHSMIMEKRNTNQSKGLPGPRVLIAGPVDTGKSTLSKILLNYAIRLGFKPTFLDLDVGQGAITVPGSIAAIPLTEPVDLIEGFSSNKAPLVYYYGYASPGENQKLYKQLVKQIIEVIDKREDHLKEAIQSYLTTHDPTQATVGTGEGEAEAAFRSQQQQYSAGLVVNTCGWVDGAGYELLLNAIETIKADIVLVIDHERLYIDLSQKFNQPTTVENQKNVTVLKLQKSGGVVSRSPQYRQNSRKGKIKEYFYGALFDYCPHRITLHWSKMQVFRIGGVHQAPSSALPIGTERINTETSITQVSFSYDLLHSVLGVSHATSKDALIRSNVAGFVYVESVDVDEKKVVLLSPSQGQLPSMFFIMGNIKWLE